VHDDNDLDQMNVVDVDKLDGGSGDDWFIWRAGEDKATGLSATEDQVDISTIN
jgi:hypothetical protein